MPQNGRIPPPETLYDFSFKDTGRHVQIRKVSTLLRSEIRRQVTMQPGYTEPQPPQSTVDYGDGNTTIPNPQHPVYQQLLTDWRQKVNEEVGNRLKTLAIMRGVVCQVDQSAVDALRTDPTLDLSAYDDHYVYVAFICIGSEDDWTDLLRAIFERSAPQEAAIAAHIATFQPDVPGKAAVQSEP